jgi:hypothetical protein
MGDKTTTLTFLAKDAASGAIKGINKHLGHMRTSAANAGKAVGGAAVTLGKLAAGAAVAGTLALGAGLAYAAKQAAEEEKGIARLDAALRANVASYKGNTDAIDKAIAAGERKAFSDDDQRAALARLATSTKDVNEAIKLNALAMDFARLKGIPLADAANIIGKVHDGNVGILSRYGIAVAKGTSATDALAQIQAAAAGQADAYGKTTAGSYESIQLAIGNVVEDVGAALLPVLSTAAAYFTDNLVPALQAAGAQFGKWMEENKPLIDQLGAFVSETLTGLVAFVTTEVIPRIVEINTRFLEFASGIAKDVGPAIIGIGERLGALVGIIVDRIIPAIVDFATRVWEGGLNRAVKAGAEVIGAVIEALVGLAEWITSNETVMAILSTAADLIGTAFGLVADAIEIVLDWLGQFGDWITGNEDLMKGLETVVDGIAGAFKQAVQWVGDFLRGLDAVARWIRENGDLLSSMFGSRNVPQWPTPKVPGAATGGWVGLRGPELRWVGERGPEYITPNNQLRPGASFTLAPGAIVVNGAGDPEAVARSVMLALKRETTRQGMSF